MVFGQQVVNFRTAVTPIHAGHRGQPAKLLFELPGLGQRVRHDGGIKDRSAGKKQFLLIDYRRQPFALHIQQVIIKTHFGHLQGRQPAESQSQSQNQPRAIEPDLLNARSLVGRHAAFMIEDVLPALNEQRWQHRQHGDQAKNQTASRNDSHFLNAFEIGKSHGEERRRGRQRARDNPLSGVNHRCLDGLLRGPALADLLFKATDKMHPKVDGQADEDWRERDGQDV